MDFYWKAVYTDGTELPQYNADGSENKYVDIDRSKLVRFALLQVNSDKPVVVLHLDQGQRLICRRRVAKHFSQDLKPQGEEVVWLVGWQQKINGRNSQMICFVFEDGHAEVRPGFKEKSQWFYAVQFLPEETNAD